MNEAVGAAFTITNPLVMSIPPPRSSILSATVLTPGLAKLVPAGATRVVVLTVVVEVPLPLDEILPGVALEVEVRSRAVRGAGRRVRS